MGQKCPLSRSWIFKKHHMKLKKIGFPYFSMGSRETHVCSFGLNVKLNYISYVDWFMSTSCKYFEMDAVAYEAWQRGYQIEAFVCVHCGLPGVYDNCAYHHQTQPASETWIIQDIRIHISKTLSLLKKIGGAQEDTNKPAIYLMHKCLLLLLFYHTWCIIVMVV